MTIEISLFVTVGVLIASGVYLLLDRALTRMLMGLLLAGNGVNLLLLILASPPGNPPIMGFFTDGATGIADPLAQAMILTAIVLNLGMAAFVLAMAYRSYLIKTDDDVDDDPEDTKVLERETVSEAPDFDASDDPLTGAQTALGDAFDQDGHRLTAEELRRARVDALDTGAMPTSAPAGGDR